MALGNLGLDINSMPGLSPSPSQDFPALSLAPSLSIQHDPVLLSDPEHGPTPTARAAPPASSEVEFIDSLQKKDICPQKKNHPGTIEYRRMLLGNMKKYEAPNNLSPPEMT
jgi:hypothetical protein